MTTVRTMGGWWPPGQGDGTDWEFEPHEIELVLDDGEKEIDVVLVTGDERKALASVPVAAVAEILALARIEELP